MISWSISNPLTSLLVSLSHPSLSPCAKKAKHPLVSPFLRGMEGGSNRVTEGGRASGESYNLK
ncbi:hypothetical protein MC7420_1361 [Coleofasciculus chthonoplastes PCC 7420]|uniref:Uncharacterized protein n=1 Tax=Coleofasciculus chthonoplastes PCC 7420 TaxID=118168 RepID=B4VR42_9CYAN|nr:hypothetical protein MC7420_1361 [Coleofasciculus chthonoplastes PCC 7420]